MMSTALINDTYHAPLLRRWESVAGRANIAIHWLDKSATKYCSSTVCAWVKALPKAMRVQKAELVLRPKQHSPEDRCSVIAAACLRNYTDAKVMPLRDLLAASKKNDLPKETVLLLPDFYQLGDTLMEWQQSQLLSVLFARHLKGQATVIYVEDMGGMGKAYGKPIYEHIKKNYTTE